MWPEIDIGHSFGGSERMRKMVFVPSPRPALSAGEKRREQADKKGDILNNFDISLFISKDCIHTPSRP
jgi:hypothetical protein